MEGVYFQAVPANFSRFLTDEERAEFRRRAERRWDSYALYWLLPVVSLVALLVADWNGLLMRGAFAALFFAWLCLTAVAVLMMRNALIETRILRTIGPGSRIVGFSGYKLQASSFVEFLAPPSSIEVVYPQGLVVRADSRLKRVFGRVNLTRTEDLPWPSVGETLRELSDLEVEELGRQMDRYSKTAWQGFGMVIGALVSFDTALRTEAARSASLGPFMDSWHLYMRPVGWLCLMGFGIYEFHKGMKHFRRLKRARELGDAEVEWDGDEFSELLLPDRLPWRTTDGPAYWRKGR